MHKHWRNRIIFWHTANNAPNRPSAISISSGRDETKPEGTYPMLKPALIAMTALAAFASAAHAGKLGTYQSDQNGFDTRTYWYDDGQEITVFDTQFVPQLTEAMVAAIRKESANPITRVVITHPNPDKFNGLSVLHKLGAVSIASKATADAMPGVDAYKRYFWVNIAKAFTDETYPKVEPVKQTFSGQSVITLKSGETITLTELKHSGVSTTQTVAKIDATGDLIVGDLVHHNAHAWLEGGIADGKPKPDLKSWIAALDELRGLGGKTVHGGRGDDASVEEAIKQEQAYLAAMDTLVSDYVSNLGAAKAELNDPAKAQAHYAKLQELAAARFPDMKLAYLVGYGVYGLVNSKL
jgi:glyoxylase-like metal-dependent hydrolase (beta-lactamase superfamily II)